MERSKIAHDPHHPGVPSGAPKLISKPMVHWTQTVHLSCVKISTTSEWTELLLEPRLWWVPSGVPKMISDRMVHFLQTVHLSCTDTNTVCKQKADRFDMTHVTLGFQRGRPKRFLSIWYVWRKLCTYIASRIALSPNGLRFHFSLVTSEYHRVCTKWFLSSNTFSKWKEVGFHMTHVT
jgi:hypothetical protein